MFPTIVRFLQTAERRLRPESTPGPKPLLQQREIPTDSRKAIETLALHTQGRDGDRLLVRFLQTAERRLRQLTTLAKRNRPFLACEIPTDSRKAIETRRAIYRASTVPTTREIPTDSRKAIETHTETTQTAPWATGV